MLQLNHIGQCRRAPGIRSRDRTTFTGAYVLRAAPHLAGLFPNAVAEIGSRSKKPVTNGRIRNGGISSNDTKYA